jgi:dihydroorotate dehydrogenase
VVNVSSPNTPGLRQLQEKDSLFDLLNRLQEVNRQKGKPKPVFLKIAPDLTIEQLDEIAEIVLSTGLTGVVATNTTISRDGLTCGGYLIDKIGAGGLSGDPLQKKSVEVVRHLAQKLGTKAVIIGVGGISTEQHAVEMLKAGAKLLQLYTGFVYRGPELIHRLTRKLRNPELEFKT